MRYALAAILSLMMTATALAHGGAYRLPPPVPRIPTPGGGLPTPTPTGGRGGVATPAHPGQLPTGPGGGLNRPPPPPAKDPVTWTSWWLFNGERLLQVRRTVEARRTATGGDTAPAVEWRDKAIEALLEALGDKHQDVSTGAALALGKSGDRRALLPLMKALKNERSDKTLREAAALALGMLADEEGRVLLTETLLDRRESTRLRAFAAFGLGLTRSPAAVPGLASVMRNQKEKTGPRAAAFLAAGHLGDEVLVPLVERALGKKGKSLGKYVQACAAHSAGRLDQPSSVKVLLKAATRRSPYVRRSVILALGRVGETDGKDVYNALTFLAKNDKDPASRAYATIALARTGRPEASGTLLRIVENAKLASHRGFALLALGVLARECDDAALSEKIGSFLRRGLASGRLSHDLRGALVTALGVMRDRPSVPRLIKILEKKGNPTLRGQVAVALAMIGDRDALPALRKNLNPKGESRLLRDVALAVGLLGDSESTRRLVDLVRDAKSEWVRGNAALALGRIGGSEAALAMIEVLADKRTSSPTRGMGAVALGHMLDEREIPALVALVEDLDYLLPLESIRELLTIL